jgi:hypothetical protein
MLVGIFVFIGITFEVFEWALSDRSGLWILKLVAALLVSLVAACGVGLAVTRILDSARSGAVLIIDGEGVMDTRQLRTILRWADVKAISFWGGGRGDLIVMFKLRVPILVKYNPFRMGHGFRQVPIDELYVLVSGLDKDEDVVVGVIETMVVRHGGYVVPYVGAPWEPPQKIAS